MTRRNSRYIRRSITNQGVSRFRHPSRLFGAADVGCVYLPGDLTRYFQGGQIVATPSMYQDSAGTTPVTAVGQPVGLRKCLVGKGPDLIQPSATSRPVLSNRVNLLPGSENFASGTWNKATSNGTPVPVVTANYATDPLGGNNGSRVQLTLPGNTEWSLVRISAPLTNIPVGVSVTSSIWIKATDASQVGKFVSLYIYDASTASYASGNRVSKHVLTADWRRVEASFSFDAISTTQEFSFGKARGTVNDGLLNANTATDFLVFGAQFVFSNQAHLPYQRVNTATDYDSDTSKFPLGLSYDGVDDGSYSASTLDMTSTDKVTVLAAVRKLSDVSTSIIVEFNAAGDAAGSASGANPGTFAVFAPLTAGAPRYNWRVRGDGAANAVEVGSFTAPTTNVLSGSGDIPADVTTFRVDGPVRGASTFDLGSGKLGNHTLFIGRRNNASLPFNGLDYGIVVIGRLLTERERKTAENWLARASGVVLP